MNLGVKVLALALEILVERKVVVVEVEVVIQKSSQVSTVMQIPKLLVKVQEVDLLREAQMLKKAKETGAGEKILNFEARLRMSI